MNGLRVGVVGGSIGGLTAAVLLHEMGCDVEVFERSSSALQGRGAGIAVLPMTERYFTELGTSLGAGGGTARQVALTLTYWSYVDRNGAIIDTAAIHYRFTSWNTLYRALLERLPPERYHLGCRATGVAQSDESGSVTSSARDSDERQRSSCGTVMYRCYHMIQRWGGPRWPSPVKLHGSHPTRTIRLFHIFSICFIAQRRLGLWWTERPGGGLRRGRCGRGRW